MKAHIKLLSILVTFIVIILIGSISYLEIGLYVNTGGLYTKDISINNERIKISGTTTNSGESFTGYKYTIKNDNLYLKLRYSLSSPLHKDGDFNITIKENAKKIKNIYLQGNKTKDNKLIWTYLSQDLSKDIN